MTQLTKCRYADKYKAIREPRCGCLTCEMKWYKAVAHRLADAATVLRVAQKNYMDNRGNDRVGKMVAKAAKDMDAILAKYVDIKLK